MSALPVTNLLRACWAEAAIAAFRAHTGADIEDALGDLLTDLMHWSDARGYDFSLALVRAEDHYHAECEEAS